MFLGAWKPKVCKTKGTEKPQKRIQIDMIFSVFFSKAFLWLFGFLGIALVSYYTNIQISTKHMKISLFIYFGMVGIARSPVIVEGDISLNTSCFATAEVTPAALRGSATAALGLTSVIMDS